MQVNHYLFGNLRGGFIKMIQEVGFSGTVVIIWEEDTRMMRGKLKDGGHLEDTGLPLRKIANPRIIFAEESKDKHYCTGLMILENCNCLSFLLYLS